MKKIITVVGARPQFIKASVVSKQLAENGIEEKIVHTGQHYDSNMSDLFFEELEIPKPAFHLGIGGQGHGHMTGNMLIKIEDILLTEKPDFLLVYGDTNSTLAGALVAAKLHIPIAHVEAGLRSFNKKMPEEINRILTDHCSSVLFAPTEEAVKNLKDENIEGEKVILSGDVMYDVALRFGEKAEEKSKILGKLELKKEQFILSTIHRAENTDSPQRLKSILQALAEISERKQVILPLHPRTRAVVERTPELKPLLSRLRVIAPVGYLDMLNLEKNAALIATDSGGVQKEAFFYKTPCVTLRNETEWVEIVDLGWNFLASPDQDSNQLTKTIEKALGSNGKPGQPYGNGNAASAIFESLSKEL